MYLDDKEKAVFEKLGFEIKDGQITERADKIALENLDYAGLGVYISKDNRRFEKVGEELVEISTEELNAEKRYMESQLN